MSGLSQQEIERRFEQSQRASDEKRAKPGTDHGLWWWAMMASVAVVIWIALVIVAVALG